jgi:transcriptional regulator GlxA family with amidase domain
MPRTLAILALDAVVPLDLGIAVQVMSYPEAPYTVTLCGARAGFIRTTTGFGVHVEADLQAIGAADTVIVPGFSPVDQDLDPAVLRCLSEASTRGCRMVSICTGAFALAAAGVLDGHRATTHWQCTDRLAVRYPRVAVDPAVLYVDDGQVLTSAGVAAGIDLCLHLIRADHGMEAATQVARRIVVAPHRDGGQAQFIKRPITSDADSSLAATRSWMLERLAEPLTVSEMASHAGLSERTFARRFVAETGCTPLRWLVAQRLDLARELLEQRGTSIEQVAFQTGFGSADNLRLHFRRHLCTTPIAYRRAFSVGRVAAQLRTSARATSALIQRTAAMPVRTCRPDGDATTSMICQNAVPR